MKTVVSSDATLVWCCHLQCRIGCVFELMKDPPELLRNLLPQEHVEFCVKQREILLGNTECLKVCLGLFFVGFSVYS